MIRHTEIASRWKQEWNAPIRMLSQMSNRYIDTQAHISISPPELEHMANDVIHTDMWANIQYEIQDQYHDQFPSEDELLVYIKELIALVSPFV